MDAAQVMDDAQVNEMALSVAAEVLYARWYYWPETRPDASEAAARWRSLEGSERERWLHVARAWVVGLFADEADQEHMAGIIASDAVIAQMEMQMAKMGMGAVQ